MELYSEKDLQNSLQEVLNVFNERLRSLRTGRPRPETFNSIKVQAYGLDSNIQSVANVLVENATSVVIIPWDKSIVQDISKAIQEANLGYQPIADGDRVRINIPLMSEESRKQTVKEMNLMLEEAKVVSRQIRHRFMEIVNKQTGVSEDMQETSRKQIQQKIDQCISDLGSLAEKKEVEIMTI